MGQKKLLRCPQFSGIQLYRGVQLCIIARQNEGCIGICRGRYTRSLTGFCGQEEVYIDCVCTEESVRHPHVWQDAVHTMTQ